MAGLLRNEFKMQFICWHFSACISQRVFYFQAKTEEQLASDKAWLVAERVWLVHRGGFAAARVLHAGMPGAEGVENLPEGRCRVKLEHGGELLDVDEEDVEKVNSVFCC